MQQEEHTLEQSSRVRRGAADNVLDVKRTYTIYLPLHAIDEQYEDDQITLESHDGAYRQTLVLGEDGEIIEDCWVRVTFTKLKPRKCYQCTLDLKETETRATATMLLFEYLPLDDSHFNKPDLMGEALSDEEEAAAVDPDFADFAFDDEEYAIESSEDDEQAAVDDEPDDADDDEEVGEIEEEDRLPSAAKMLEEESRADDEGDERDDDEVDSDEDEDAEQELELTEDTRVASGNLCQKGGTTTATSAGDSRPMTRQEEDA